MVIKNQDIRKAAQEAGVRLWQISDELGMQDSNFSRMLRKELDQKTKANIFTIIDTLGKQNAEAV